MSNNFQVPAPPEEPSDKPTELTIGEFAEFSPSKRSAAQYEARLRDIRAEVKMYRKKCDTLQKDLNKELKFRSSYADIKRGKVEMMAQLVVVTLLSGVGGLLMGIFPRSPSSTPAEFWVGASMVGVGVLLGVIVTPITLGLCYLWPKLSAPEN